MTFSWVELGGTANTRDLGGLLTLDGRAVASRRLLRSDDLQDLSDADVELLVRWGVRTVLDLRSDVEVERRGAGPLNRRADIEVRRFSLGRRSRSSAETEGGFSQVYVDILRDHAPEVVAALRAIALSEGASLVHCTAGKDRTGIVVAMALSAVGVRPEEVVADYAASAVRFPQVLRRLAAVSDSPELSAAARLTHTPRAVTMERFLEVLAQEPGGARGWLGRRGWSAHDQSALEGQLLTEPGDGRCSGGGRS